MTEKEIQKEIQKASKDKTINILKKNKNIHLGPTTLGMAFEKISIENKNDENAKYFSKPQNIINLSEIHPDFQTTNGCQWARSDTSYLGKKYNIIKTYKNNRVETIKLDGQNINISKNAHHIPKKIKDALKNKKCAILDTNARLEIDHKNGKYNDIKLSKNQKVEDFQILSKSANDAKRQHCKECKACGKRYDAKRLGYSASFVLGDENTKNCVGCYWYDPIYFNKKISENFEK